MSPILSGYEIIGHADKHGYAVGAFNTVNLEISRAIYEAAVEENSPFMITATSGAIKYAGAENIADIARNLNAEYGTRNCLHLDHGPDINYVKIARKAGFTSFMLDGSKHPLEENIRLTREVRNYLGKGKWQLEGELGRIFGVEDDVKVSKREMFFTDPDEAVRFVKETGVDSLAVSIGNVHGIYRGKPKLDYKRLEEIRERVKMPIVLHGASGLSDQSLRRAIELGVRKINFDTELRIAFKKGFQGYLSKNPGETDIRKYLAAAIESVKKVVIHKMRVLKSSGMA